MSLKVHYFDFGGRAEAIRLALHIGGVSFEDVRFPREKWAELKPLTPFGGTPTLEVDGVQYGQSNSLIRYAGKLGGLYPQDNLLALKADEILDACEDLINALSPSLREQDPEKKAELRKKFADALPGLMGNLEKVLERNGSNPFAIGADISVADCKLAPLLGWFKSGMLDGVPVDFLDATPRLAALFNATYSHPKVVEWNAAHPSK